MRHPGCDGSRQWCRTENGIDDYFQRYRHQQAQWRRQQIEHKNARQVPVKRFHLPHRPQKRIIIDKVFHC